jgi:hypothetical protein
MVGQALVVTGRGLRTVASRRIPRAQARFVRAGALVGSAVGIVGGLDALWSRVESVDTVAGYTPALRLFGAVVATGSLVMFAIGLATMRRALASREDTVELRVPTLGFPPAQLLRLVVAAMALVLALGTGWMQRLALAAMHATGTDPRELPAFTCSGWTLACAIALGAVAIAATPTAPSMPRWRAPTSWGMLIACAGVLVAVSVSFLRIALAHLNAAM